MEEENDCSDFSCTPPEIASAAKVATLNLLPEKSRGKYEKQYELFITWCNSRKVRRYTENVMMAYFSEKAKTMNSATLWSVYSMLRSVLTVRNNIDISQYTKLIAYLKRQSVGYKPKKSRTFTKEELFKFLYEAPDEIFLMKKYLDFDNLPDTNFSCVGKVIGGYYADLETNCQMFHVCTIGQLDEPMDIRFLCLNGTVFDQETRVCERIDEVDCSKSEQFYSLNLELYGNTQPPILEEDFPVEIKRSSSTTSTSTTTTQRPSNPKSSSQPYYTTSVPPTTTRTATKVITSHHFPVVNSPDIRFNPEEINISLNPGAPPDITRSQVPISFQQQSYSNSEKNTRVTVTTHTTIYKNDKPHRVPLLPTINTPSQILLEHENVERPTIEETTQTPKSIVSYGLTHNQGLQAATPTEVNYGFTYQQTEESVDYNTEIPPHPYQYQISIANLRPPTAQDHPYHSSFQTTSKRPHKVNFPVPTTYRNHPAYTSIRTSSSQQFHSQRTDKPPRLQLPLPLLPTLPPLTFSSPAPFTLGRHIETKRFTNDHHHQSPPRIIISASASVSDNSGRRLNYSLGTIGASHLLGPSPATYDEYKDDDVGLDPFYHDVPKIKSLRHKRSTLREEDVIKNDQEAADLLRFLFNWYSKRQKMRKVSIPVTSEDITEINEELAPIVEASTGIEEDYANLFVKTNKEDATEPIIEQNLESTSAKLESELLTKTPESSELEELAKMLEMLNTTNIFATNLNQSEESMEEKKHSEIVELLYDVGNTSLNETESHKSYQVPVAVGTTSLNETESHKSDQIAEPVGSISLNETESHKSDQVPVSSGKTKKPKQGRNHRRRTGKSSTTPRRSKKPRSHRKTNHGRAANSTRAHEGVGNELHSNKSQKQSGVHSKNARRNSSRGGKPRKTNTVGVNLEISKSEVQILDDASRNEENVHEFKVKQLLDIKSEVSNNKAIPESESVSVNFEIADTAVENKSDMHKEEAATSAFNYENIRQKDLSKIYELLGEPTTTMSIVQLNPLKSPENDTEDVEIHESNQHEHVVLSHEDLEILHPENISSENVTAETINLEDINSDNNSSEHSTFENTSLHSTTIENFTTENEISENDKLNNLKYKEHSTEVVPEITENPTLDDEVKVATTSEPEYISTTIQPNHENLQAQSSSYRNEENLDEEENDKMEHSLLDHEDSHQINKDLNEMPENTNKSIHESDYGDYDNETESVRNVEAATEYLKEEYNEDLHSTDKSLEQNLEEATLHIDLLNQENNPKMNDKKELTEVKKDEIYTVDTATDRSTIDSTTSQSESENYQEYNEEQYTYVRNKNIVLTPRHRSKQRLLLPQLRYINRDDVELSTSDENSNTQHEENKNQTTKRGHHNFKIANRRTYEDASSEEELANNAKLSAISPYKSRSEEQRRRNNYIRSRKFISNSSSSKNTENTETIKIQHKEYQTDDKSILNEETPVLSEIIETHYEDHDSLVQDKNISTEENPIIPDYVDDNYEPLTYHEPPKTKEIEYLATTTFQDPDLEQNTVTDKLEQLNSLEHSTDFNEVSDLHDHTFARSSEDEENTTILDESDNPEEVIPNSKGKLETSTVIQDDELNGTTEARYEVLTEATTALDSPEVFTTEPYIKYADEQTTELPTTQLTTQTNEITTAPTTTELVDAIPHLQTTPEPTTTTTVPEATTNSSPHSEYDQTTNANTETTIDLVHGPVFTTDYPTEVTTMNLETTQATSVAPSSTSDSSVRISTLTEPDAQDLTTPLGEGTTNKYQHLKTRLPWYKRQNNARRKEHAKHRFSTNSRRTGVRERTKLENKISHVLNNLNRSSSNSHSSADKLLVDRNPHVNNNNTAKLSNIESVGKSNITNINTSTNNILEGKHSLADAKIEQPHPPEVVTVNSPEVTTIKSAESIETTIVPEEQQQTTVPTELERLNSGEVKVDIPVTDAPLLKSANPTKAKYTKIVFTTTPLSKLVRVELRKDMHGRRYSFNCFNRKVHQFYSDARDCRLFHYCTLGYTKNQMVDMKFVCDAGTYFDEEKLICTKVKPARCL